MIPETWFKEVLLELFQSFLLLRDIFYLYNAVTKCIWVSIGDYGNKTFLIRVFSSQLSLTCFNALWQSSFIQIYEVFTTTSKCKAEVICLDNTCW